MSKLLGIGGEGAVYAAKPRNCQYNTDVALKLQLNMKDAEIAFIKTVMEYQNQFDHDPIKTSGIITIYEKFQYQNYQVLIMELGGQNLFDYINTKKNIPINEKFRICLDLFRPIYFLHSKKLFHRDIKPENFIKVKDRFKLIDFGLTKGLTQDLNRTKGIGTLFYSAPELIEQRNDYNEKVDIWALGCVFYEIFTGETFIQSQVENEIRQEILQFKHKKDSYYQRIDQINIPQECQAALKKMLEPNPNQRLTVFEALDSFNKYQDFSLPSQQPQIQKAHVLQSNFQPQQKIPGQSQFQGQKQLPQSQQGTIEQFSKQIIKVISETITPAQNQQQKPTSEQSTKTQNNKIDMEFKNAVQEIHKVVETLMKTLQTGENKNKGKEDLQKKQDPKSEEKEAESQNVPYTALLEENQRYQQKIQELERLLNQQDMQQQKSQVILNLNDPEQELQQQYSNQSDIERNNSQQIQQDLDVQQTYQQ
ncbi:unnamed protein product (macronuclear) [Paramecium tetraurelia]|uniref:Protein kinase domain-containing protein n=1 Tax=Paramecium tetraurelia TaxID=5888 RepID=A0E131_PARTE|nr:uncharacterized protein GSPATT00022167001 [Paramecium tetraurelia]CAK88998.1 unnamed protein product [Paramecium tetraurelia]|eukprot:XP_001456395.1 hypothetical protein (macronuclear) [Paramecium tetraurelia strain d4-2]